MERKEIAVDYKMHGHNCCESVVKSFSDLIELDEDEIRKITSGFAIGMGCFTSTCGALIGANIVLGLLNNTNLRTPTLSAKLLNRFKELSGDVTCRVLKGIETGKVLCSCNDCVKNAVVALEEILKEIGVINA